MHRNKICPFLIISFALFSFGNSASLLDLLSWDIEEKSDVVKRDDGDDTVIQRACACNGGPSCMCCVDFNITYFDFGGPGCVSMKYISQEDGISVNVSYGDNLLHSQHMKGPNPEPACTSLMANFAEVCARFSDLHPVENGLKGCLQLEPKLFGQLQAQFDMGCFVIGPDGMKLNTNSNLTTPPPLPPNENENKNQTQAESEELNEEELIAETAEQSLVFFGNWLGLFGKPNVNDTNVDSGKQPSSAGESGSTETSRKIHDSPISSRNYI